MEQAPVVYPSLVYQKPFSTWQTTMRIPNIKPIFPSIRAFARESVKNYCSYLHVEKIICEEQDQNRNIKNTLKK